MAIRLSHHFTLAALLTLAMLGGQPVSAATLAVTDCGDTGGPGQLRTAIVAATPGDTITVPACVITLALAAGGQLTINKSLTITGAGPTQTILDGGGVTRVLNVSSGTVTLAGLTIRNGNGNGTFGGGVLNNGGTLTLRSAIVTNNHAGSSGGGILNLNPSGSLTVTDSVISNNQAMGGGAGGGGIMANGTLTLANTTISGNSAGLAGGGLVVSGTATATNLTVSGNTSPRGGGIEVEGTNFVLTLVNGTVVGNIASAGPGGGLRNAPGGGFTVRNTIVADNTATAGGANCSGTISSAGHNLETGSGCGFAQPGDLSNANPLLGPLQNNGGPGPTHALLPGSPAIDTGDNTGCPATDQRGVPRPLDMLVPGSAVCDIGAFEVETLGFVHASLSLNTTAVPPGAQLQGTVTASNDGTARPLDVYLVFVLPPFVGPALGCPGGDALAFQTFGGVVLTCLSSPVQTFAPLVTNITLPGGVPPTAIPLFALPWPAVAPLGPYAVALALTPVGAFADGRVNPLAELVIAPASFTAVP
jgi:hypothetical protein